MPRKLFRKYLPTRDSVRQNRYIGFFGSLLQHHNLWHLHRRSVAGGVAVGLFCGLIPGPLQMLSAALLAVLFRVNLPVAVIATWYTNPLTIVPLYIAAYSLGKFVIGGEAASASYAGPNWFDLPLAQWLPAMVDWLTGMGKPFIFGLLLLAAILAVTGYVSVLAAWRLHVSLAWRNRRRARIARGKT
jgi:uncharacterized protein